MSGLEGQRHAAGEGLQVLSVEEDGTYRSDDGALRRVTEQAAARALPVAVVSVAGATRGGKSFLLDFFLRYLYASDEARESGAWIGADTDVLTGFSWRGGWQRNTTGILLWSEPIIVTRIIDGHAKKIAVLLLDTQGTFDNASTVKDCTTIFAMSTLMSSVQIYNLAQIIKEDDLQHLQLFTEYGKLARTQEDVKPFQSLIFRVRDWTAAFEHSYGAQGGENYLRTVLETQSRHREIQELRAHIRSSFESVTCFLTPHPGMAVNDQNFSGRLCDILPEFKASLLEFVPMILHPSRLIPKVINGQDVKLGELPTYFRSYLDIFNSDDLPTPVNILQATSAAFLETALSASREEYISHMQRSTGGELSVSRDAVPRAHAAAMEAARATFAARKTLALPALATERLRTLLQELEALLPNYIAVNHAKILKTVSEARAAYEAVVAEARGDRPLCLHPLDAPVLHAAASTAAVAVFAAGRQAPDDRDDDRNEILQWLDNKGKELQASNALSNAAARVSAGARYSDIVRRAAAGGALGADKLAREHAVARAAALDLFRATRTRLSDHSDADDHYLAELIANINEQYQLWEASNRSGTRAALRSAAAAYHTRLAGVWGGHGCLHPNTLRREHEKALRAALAELSADTNEPGGEIERELRGICLIRYEELRRINEEANEALVTSAYSEYCRLMDVNCAPSITSLLIVPWLLKVLVQLPKCHERACTEALQYFRTHRRTDAGDEDDDYIDTLNSKLRNGYEVYCNPLQALARELNIPIGS